MAGNVRSAGAERITRVAVQNVKWRGLLTLTEDMQVLSDHRWRGGFAALSF